MPGQQDRRGDCLPGTGDPVTATAVRKNKAPPQGDQSCPASIWFSQPREEEKEVHPCVFLFSLFKVNGFEMLSWLGFLTCRAPSADCYVPSPCIGELIFPKDGESDGQGDNLVYPSVSRAQQLSGHS